MLESVNTGRAVRDEGETEEEKEKFLGNEKMRSELWKAAEVIRGGLGVGMMYAERIG